MAGIHSTGWLRVLLIAAVVTTVGLSVAVAATSAGGPPNPVNDEYPVDGPAIHQINYSGNGYIDNQYETVGEHPGPPFVWHDDELVLNVTVFKGDAFNQSLSLCGKLVGGEGNLEGELDCIEIPASDQSNVQVEYTVPAWPENATGEHFIVLELRTTDDPPTTEHATREQVHVLEKDGDLSGDGLTNEEEVALGTDFAKADTSGNGLTDWEEVRLYGTDPLKVDTTGDGVSDGTLVRLGLNPTVPYALHMVVGAIIVVLGVLMVGTAVISLRLVSPQWNLLGRGDLPATAGPTPPAQPNEFDEAENSPTGLLSDEELIVTLLHRHGGRFKQKDFVNQTDWSKAKVSRELSKLEDKGVITRFRRGRENIVELASDQAEPVTEDSAESASHTDS